MSLALTGQLKAPPGRYRLVGVDTFEGPYADFLVGDFTDKSEAIAEATARTRAMTPFYVYDSTGKLVFSVGRPSTQLPAISRTPGRDQAWNDLKFHIYEVDTRRTSRIAGH